MQVFVGVVFFLGLAAAFLAFLKSKKVASPEGVDFAFVMLGSALILSLIVLWLLEIFD